MPRLTRTPHAARLRRCWLAAFSVSRGSLSCLARRRSPLSSVLHRKRIEGNRGSASRELPHGAQERGQERD
nr:unnamed protein product [Digitaria exilis]